MTSGGGETADRKNLKTWPYAHRHLRQTMDPELIESHGRIILARALNIGRVAAFVGSGVAESYGRISWKAMVRSLVERAQELAKRTVNERNVEVAGLKRTLDTLYEGRTDLKAEDYLMIFQVCEQIEAAAGGPGTGKGDVGFRDRVIRMMKDDEGHARALFHAALGDQENGDKVFEAMTAKGQEISMDALFRALAQVLEEDWSASLDGSVAGILKAKYCPSTDQRGTRLPQRRYVHASAVAWISGKGDWQEKFKIAVRAKFAAQGEKAASREDTFHLYRDPIRLLGERLNIAAFLTTNYDSEISRFMQSRMVVGAGERAGEPPSRGYGEVVFDGNRTGEVIALVAGSQGQRRGVLHLHGSVDPASKVDADPGAGLLVTENDYQRRYYRLGPDRDLVTNAIEFAFSANTLLFVGLGMTEGDLLRPLRSFMATPAQFGKKMAVTLMPGIGSQAERDRQRISLFGRYGVYAIHYGQARMDEKTSNEEFWLHRVGRLVKALQNFADHFVNESGRWQEPSKSPSFTEVEAAYEGCLYLLGKMKTIEELPQSDSPELNLEVECDVIKAVFTAFKEVFNDFNPGIVDEEFKARMRSWRIALDGAWGVVIATFASAALLRVRLDWDAWRADWFRIPQARPAAKNWNVGPSGEKAEAGGAHMVLHHCIHTPDEPEIDQLSPRFYANGPSGGYQDLVDAVLNSPGFQKISGRRLLVLVAKRGAGKGSLIGKLLNGRGKGRLEDLLKHLVNGDVIWIGQAIFNLTFTHEIMAVFDRVADYLGQCAETALLGMGRSAPDGLRKMLERGRFQQTHDHLGRLRTMMEVWADIGKWCKENKSRPKFRVFLCIQHIGIFFDHEGRPKNGQLGCVFDAILDKKFADAPLDIMFTSTPSHLPGQFRVAPPDMVEGCGGAAKTIPLLHLAAERRGDASQALDRDTLERHGVLLAQDKADDRKDEPPACGGIHIVHSVRASTFILAFYPRIAVLLARSIAIRELGDGWLDTPRMETGASDDRDLPHYHDIFKAETPDIPHAIRKVVKAAFEQFENFHSNRIQRALGPTLAVLYAALLEEGYSEATTMLLIYCRALAIRLGKRDLPQYHEEAIALAACLLADARQAVSNKQGPLCDACCKTDCKKGTRSPPCSRVTGGTDAIADNEKFDDFREVAFSIAEKWVNLTKDDDLVELRTKFHQVCEACDTNLGQIFEDVGRNRFALTVLASACYESTANLNWNKKGADRAHVHETMLRVDRLVERVTNTVTIALHGRKASAVIAAVMEHFDRHHRDGRKLAFRKPIEMLLPKSDQSSAPRANMAQFLLMKEILWTLAMIGRPIELGLLQVCSQVRAAARALLTKNGRTKTSISEADIDKAIAQALSLCVARCLTLQLNPLIDEREPKKKDQKQPEFDPRARYTVHRLLQRHLLAEMGASPQEVGEWGPYMLSLYSSQSDELPQITHAAHTRILSLIKELSCYPGHRPEGGTLHETLAGKNDALWLQGRALRAAYGIVRTIYCVGILTRLQKRSVEPPNDEPPFEEFRRLVRWMLRMAVQIEEKVREANINKTGNLHLHQLPFYAEEIVWLYNECGVLSLVCGALNDAQALFEMALKAAKEFMEPSEAGPLHVRIRLNQAMVFIERGRGSQIRTFLREIAAHRGEHPVPKLLARGYLAHIDHMDGNLEKAREEYKTVIQDLIRLNRSRAAAMFSRHLGDLYRADPREDGSSAEYWLNLAEQLSQKGMHKDVSYHVELSQARLYIAQKRNSTEIHKRLDAVETYGHQLGLVRLLCKVADLRANLLLNQGETRLALAEATRSLELAMRNDLQIQKVRALASLGEIYVERGQPRQAKPLLDLGIRLAEKAGANATLRHLTLIRDRLDTGG